MTRPAASAALRSSAPQSVNTRERAPLPVRSRASIVADFAAYVEAKTPPYTKFDTSSRYRLRLVCGDHGTVVPTDADRCPYC